ncbi:excinuclease ABC subunit UvrA, partial [Patescibacteria group bacterium]
MPLKKTNSSINKTSTKDRDQIIVHGTRVNNLKNINIKIPRNKFVVVTGISGSGKSSLAFDTIYAEGQRRYVESLSSYARQFLGLHDKPDVDQITGLSPAIAIDQKTGSNNPRSTVGTITEIYDFLRLLYARVGHPHCPECGQEILCQTQEQIINQILSLGENKEVSLLAPVVKNKRGEHRKILQEISKAGFVSVRLDNEFYPIEEAVDLVLDKTQVHTIEVVIDNLKIPNTNQVLKNIKENKNKLENHAHPDKLPEDENEITIFLKKIELALDLGNGMLSVIESANKKEHVFSQYFSCPKCNINLPEIDPRFFSFNSPNGACKTCTGLGRTSQVVPDLVIPNKKLTIAQGAIRPWSKIGARSNWQLMEKLNKVAEKNGFSINTIVMYGSNGFEGVVTNLMQKYKETNSEYIRTEIEKYMRSAVCEKCEGKRLNSTALSI